MAERLKKGNLTKKEKPNLVEGRSSESNRRREREMEDDKLSKENGEQPNTTIQQMYGQKKNKVRRDVDKAKREMEEELYKR